MVTEVFEQAPASKPKATSSTQDLEKAQRKANHLKEQRRLLKASCHNRFQDLKKSMAKLQTVVQHELPNAVSHVEELGAIHKGEIDEALIAASAAPVDGANSSVCNTFLGTPTGEGSTQHEPSSLGSESVLPRPVQQGGSKSSAPSVMSDASRRCRDPDDADVPSAKRATSLKEIEGSEFYSAAARGDEDASSDHEDACESDTLFHQLMSDAESKVLRYGPIQAWSKEQLDSDGDL